MARRKTSATLREIGTITLLSLAVLWLCFLVFHIYQKEEIARTTVAETRHEMAALDARKMALQGTVHDLDTDRGQEASVRETFGVARPGEEVIIVVPKKEIAPPPSPTFWQKFKAVFGF